MKQYVVLYLLSFLFIAVTHATENPSPSQKAALAQNSDWILKQAFLQKKSGLQVQGGGKVIALLSDDLSGDRHQRFILRLQSGQTLLVAHNIDIAPRLDGLQKNGWVNFYGQYEWNSQGGVIHWTHHDPDHQHINGWLTYRGKIYQ